MPHEKHCIRLAWPGVESCYVCDAIRAAVSEAVADAQARADAGWQGLRNIYRIATGDDCETNLALGLATSVVAERIRERNAHRLRADEAERDGHTLKARLAEVEAKIAEYEKRPWPGCRMLSLGDACACSLCQRDRRVAEVERDNALYERQEAGLRADYESLVQERDALRARCEVMREEMNQVMVELTRLAPSGSPPPGGPVEYARWVRAALAAQEPQK